MQGFEASAARDVYAIAPLATSGHDRSTRYHWQQGNWYNWASQVIELVENRIPPLLTVRELQEALPRVLYTLPWRF